MKNIISSLIIVLFCIATFVSADEQEIRMLLARPFVKAEFKKVRKLKILSRPFVTSGKILFLPDKGLVWQTLHPIEDTLLISHGGVSQFQKDNPKPVKIDNPVVKSASKVFITILSLDLEKIKRLFTIKEQPETEGNKIYILTPKDETLKKVISFIKMSGKTRVETIYIEETSGDSTLVELSHEQFDKSVFSPSELQLLELM